MSREDYSISVFLWLHLFIWSPPPSSSHTRPFLWLTWGHFWSSSWIWVTHCPAPPCVALDSHPGIHPAGWRRWLLHLAHPERRSFLSSSECQQTGLSPFSHLSGDKHEKHRFNTCKHTIQACISHMPSLMLSLAAASLQPPGEISHHYTHI